MATAQAGKQVITLRGSVSTVVEFFGYALNTILYQRGVYPADCFTTVSKYKLQVLVTTDKGLKAYLGNVLQQLSEWFMQKLVQRLVLVITGADGSSLERWQFDIETEAPNGHPQKSNEDAVQREIQAIIKQITATQTFLPLLPDQCSFDLLVYTHKDADVPNTWELTDPKLVVNATNVKLRSFSTSVHKVEASVTYRDE
ncbi:Mitotic spindle assembly checkpoint protein MAD2A [Diplonema papillatum]|nr:Mitotic spindle assembly checkpoint protein MAD2A [Diplonema papillatum]